MTSYLKPEHDIRIEEVPGGVLVSQEGHQYLARRWRLTPQVRRVLDLGIEHGLTCLWRSGHPIGLERHHISFSFTHARASWVFAIGGEAGPPRLKRVTFNKQLKEYFKHSGLDWVWNWENAGGKNIFIDPNDLESVLQTLPLDHIRRGDLPVTRRSPTRSSRQFYAKESDLERELYGMIRRGAVPTVEVQTQRRFDANDRFEVAPRPDILVADHEMMIVIELKLHEAGEADLGQIDRYLRNQAIAAACSGRRLHGVLVAYRFAPAVLMAAKSRSDLTLVRYQQSADGELTLQSILGSAVLDQYLSGQHESS
ncbi:MAG: hypothetical protein JXB46_09785 [Candidatus Eisenbacteria bacterium]|nr:hypothetical protein [Candidatus Eisenbacteria bacterium]